MPARAVERHSDLKPIRLRRLKLVRVAALIWPRQRQRTAAARAFAVVFVERYGSGPAV